MIELTKYKKALDRAEHALCAYAGTPPCRRMVLTPKKHWSCDDCKLEDQMLINCWRTYLLEGK